MPTDDFSGSGALGGDWTVRAGSFTQSGGNCYGDTNSASSFAIYTTGAVGDDHESEITLQPRGSGQYFGPVVRGNTSDGACANADAGADGLYVSTWSAGGAQTVIIGPVTCPAAGTRIKLSAVGTQLHLYFDDVEQTSLGSPWTPAGLPATGRYGICAYSNSTTTGASSWTGADVASAFDLALASGVVLSGRLAATGDVSAGSPFDLALVSGVALSGRLAAAGDIDARQANPFSVAPTPVAIAARLAITGNIGFRRAWEFEPPLALPQMGGALRITGDIEFGKTFDLATTIALALQGRAAATGDIRAGSPFDLAAGGITLHGALAVAGDVVGSATPPAPAPAPAPVAEDPLSAKFLARRKRPNIRMRWGSGEEPEPPVPEPAPIEPAPEPPRLARGLDLGLLPEPPAPPAPAAPAPKDAPPAVPAAPVAPPAVPAAPVVPPVALPPDLTTEVAALRAAHASLQQEMQQAAAQAVQRAADIYTAMQQQTAHLERELAQARSEITSLRTKIERDARNRRRAEEIARKLLDDK